MVDAPALRQSRTITSVGMEEFDEKVNRHVSKLGNIKRDIDSIFMDIAENPVMNLERAKMYKTSLTKFMKQYERASGEYAAYLQGQRHEAAKREETSRALIANVLQEKVSTVLKQLNSILPVPRAKSQMSGHSHISASSHLTSVILQHTAKVEEARAKLKYAKEEAELMRKETEIKAAQCLLSVKKEFDAAKSSLSAIDYDSLRESYMYIPPCEEDTGEDDLGEKEDNACAI